MDEYDKLAEKTDNRMCEIDAELIGLEQPDESDEMTISNLLNLAKKRRRAIQKLETCREEPNLRLLVSNLEIKQKRLSFNLLEPFNIIKKWTLVQYGSPDWTRTNNLEVNSFLLHH